ncbi:serine O-acetyltransferase [Leptospira langatensis]|uniref:Serine acetyltransferase n=1 Tax=Leptospira langatensis TaxID=2484983 RepID=A0A5F1ZTI8_9LEPT|nr:serine O-acetyltransferase [Leptospira langatensis]TGK03102.1 serine O-acetyltransferase [Leptospira langatensis]TGL41859.1 serine O-acetyltransferase [Leptospira langatensis]
MFENIKAIRKNDPAAKSYIEIIVCYPGLHALWFHSIAHLLYRIGLPLIPRMINTFARFLTGVDIHPGAKIAPGIFIDHGQGVVIGETAEIAKGCLILQGVTLGGTGKESGKRHPTLKENVVVGAGAKILGNIVIETNVRIGAGSVVLRDVPPDCTVVGVPGKVVRSKIDFGKEGERMLDHGELPDPVARVFSILVEKVDTLQKEVNELYARVNLSEKKPAEKKGDDELNEFIHGDGI